MMEALRSSETSVLTRSRRRNIPEEGILIKKLKSHKKKATALDTVGMWVKGIQKA
jgi:hypothetical protein